MSKRIANSSREKFDVYKSEIHKKEIQSIILRSRALFSLNVVLPPFDKSENQIIGTLICKHQFNLLNENVLIPVHIIPFWKSINCDNEFIAMICTPRFFEYIFCVLNNPQTPALWLRVLINFLSNAISVAKQTFNVILSQIQTLELVFIETHQLVLKHTILLLFGDLILSADEVQKQKIRNNHFQKIHLNISKLRMENSENPDYELFLEGVCYFYRVCFEHLDLLGSNFEEVS